MPDNIAGIFVSIEYAFLEDVAVHVHCIYFRRLSVFAARDGGAHLLVVHEGVLSLGLVGILELH